MKKFCVCLLCLLLFAGCGRSAAEEPIVLADDDGESASVTIASPEAITAAETLDASQITCEAKYNAENVVCGFHMRFPQSAQFDALLSDRGNLYFGSASNDACFVMVPVESVRVLTDSETHEYDVTLLFSADELKGNQCTVSFYIAPRDDASHALFCAQKDIEYET